MQTTGIDRPFERRQRHPLHSYGAIALLRQLTRPLLHGLAEILCTNDRIDEPPVLRALTADTVRSRAEDVCMITAHLPLVGDAGQASGPWEHAQERNFRKADRGGPIVDQHDLVTGKRKLVAAASRRAIARREKLEAGVAARILDPVTRFVGELAEVHLPGVTRLPEHVDIGAGAEHAILRARDDNRADLGMLETDALQDVVKLDVDAEIV